MKIEKITTPQHEGFEIRSNRVYSLWAIERELKWSSTSIVELCANSIANLCYIIPTGLRVFAIDPKDLDMRMALDMAYFHKQGSRYQSNEKRTPPWEENISALILSSDDCKRIFLNGVAFQSLFRAGYEIDRKQSLFDPGTPHVLFPGHHLLEPKKLINTNTSNGTNADGTSYRYCLYHTGLKIKEDREFGFQRPIEVTLTEENLYISGVELEKMLGRASSGLFSPQPRGVHLSDSNILQIKFRLVKGSDWWPPPDPSYKRNDSWSYWMKLLFDAAKFFWSEVQPSDVETFPSKESIKKWITREDRKLKPDIKLSESRILKNLTSSELSTIELLIRPVWARTRVSRNCKESRTTYVTPEMEVMARVFQDYWGGAQVNIQNVSSKQVKADLENNQRLRLKPAQARLAEKLMRKAPVKRKISVK